VKIELTPAAVAQNAIAARLVKLHNDGLEVHDSKIR
jgi:hypothetical protein